MPKLNNKYRQIFWIINFAQYTSKIATMVFLLVLYTHNACVAEEAKYNITPLPHGGYSVDIILVKRHWKPITAEGFFPKERKKYKFEIVGNGEDWSNRNQKGFYYSMNDIVSKRKIWDLGYAWVDHLRKFIYFNFYWASSPDEIIPSDINGRYSISD
ncbi:MAG: hypothetical protein ACOY32_07845 [Thermodesulfobacteriota bacterium]